MALIPAATYTFTDGTTALAAEVNANFANLRSAINSSVLFLDVAGSVSVTHTFTAAQTFTGGINLTGGSSNLVVGGTASVAGVLTATGGVVGALTGNATTATALATPRAIALGGVLSGSANFDGSAGITITASYVAGQIVNAAISASAAIAYSKLSLTGAIVNADLAGSIAYSKLSLTGAIVNADISASAAIASSKLATVAIAQGGTGLTTTPTNGKLLIGNGTGFTLANLTAGSNITITNSAGGITIASAGGGSGPADGDYGDISISGSGTVYTIDPGVIVDSQIASGAAIADSKLATISTAGKVANSATTAVSTNTADKIVLRDGSGNFAAGAVTVSSIQNAGVQVLGPRATGWAISWGTTSADRTVTLSEASVNGAASLATAADVNDVILLYRAFKALHDDLISHGAIGT